MDFLFVKVTEGIVKDKVFDAHWTAAKNRVLRGGYHFFRPSVDPKLAARGFVETLRSDIGELPEVLDLETTDERPDTLDRAETWCALFKNMTGRDPIIYSTIPFMKEIGALQKTVAGEWKHPWLIGKVFWLAMYPYDLWPDQLRDQRIQNVMDGKIEIHVPNEDILPPLKTTIWQWTSRGKPEQVPGYYIGWDGKKAIDFNIADPKWLSGFRLPTQQNRSQLIVDNISFTEDL